MKNFKKIVITMLISCMLLVPFAATVSATDLVDPDNISSMLSYFGIDINDPESIQNAIDQIKNGGLSGILNMLGIDIADMLDELQEYLGQMTPPTTQGTTTEEEATTEEETTEEPTTEVPTTSAPVYTPVYPSYSYTPTTPATTLPPETTTFEFIPPEQIYTEAFTTTVFNPVVEDDLSTIDNDTNPIKTAIGILLLVGSGVGVIIVALALKRNRI